MEFGVWVFVGGVKPEDLEKNREKPSKEGRTINKINPHVTPGLVIRCSLRYAIPSSQLVWFVSFFL